MAKIPIKFILVILLAAVGCHCQSDNPGGASSWAKLQISPDTLSSMKYGNFLIEIYEHANNHKAKTTAKEKKYFYAPIALLDHKSALSAYNTVTKQHEMKFRVEMWNDNVENKVLKHLKEIVDHEIKSNAVRVIPLEKVILTSTTPVEDYSLSPVWTNYDKSTTLQLSLTCYDKNVCDELAHQMRSVPEQFDHLKLLYSLSSQTSQTKQTTITIDSITSGQMFTKLLQKFGDKKDIFLTANDEKKMLAETASNIRLETFDDSEVGSPDTESQIYNILKDLLITSRTTINEQSDKMWESVFWNEENYRPDKTTRTLNEIINKMDRETQKKLADMFQKSEKQSEIKETNNSNNKDVEIRREKQIREETQSKDGTERDIKISRATDQGQISRSQTRDDRSETKRSDDEVNVHFHANSFGFGGGSRTSNENSNAHNTEQQNEKTENRKNNLDEQNRNLVNKERIQHNYDTNSWADVDRISSVISGKMANDSDSSRRVEISKDDVEKLLQESRDHVQWDGEKFVPKPMQLSRMNMGNFRDSQSFQDRNVRVRYTNAELSAPIKFMKNIDELIVTDEWNNLRDKLKDTVELLNTTVMDLEKMRTELSNVKRDLTNKLEGTTEELEEARANINDLSRKLNATEKKLEEMEISTEHLSTELETRTSEIVDIGQMPTSCADLQRMGHKLSGFFSVKGLQKMEMIYCNFNPNKNDKQKWIGYADVKSAPVHFYVQRNSSFKVAGIPIPFNLAVVNEGNAMNLTSGKFTAPRPGIYFFSFTGLANFPASSSTVNLGVTLYLNGRLIGRGYTEEAHTVAGQLSPLTVQSTLNLKKDDQVWVGIGFMSSGVFLRDGDNHYTHFTGFMLGEETVASL